MTRSTPVALAATLLTAGCGGAEPAPEHPHHHHGHGHHGGMAHDFEDAERWAQRFEDPARDAWQQPELVVGWLVDRPDLVVLDIGAATGYLPSGTRTRDH